MVEAETFKEAWIRRLSVKGVTIKEEIGLMDIREDSDNSIIKIKTWGIITNIETRETTTIIEVVNKTTIIIIETTISVMDPCKKTIMLINNIQIFNRFLPPKHNK